MDDADHAQIVARIDGVDGGMFDSRKYLDGRIVLIHGDSESMLMAGTLPKCDAIVSDPPYGIGFQQGGGGKNSEMCQKNLDPIIGDDRPFDPQPWIASAPRTAYKAAFDFGGEPRIFLWGADRFKSRLPDYGTMLAWDKHLGVGPDDSFADCEWAWCGRKVKREVFRWLWKGVVAWKSDADLPPPSVKGGNGYGGTRFARVHVSQKPVELMRWSIEKVRPPVDGVVLDPYMGSGTTGIAALLLGLRFVGIEIDRRHFEVACARIERVIENLTPQGVEEVING